MLEIVPHAAPLHPCPGTALATLQFTPAFDVPLTIAVNGCVLPAWPAGATNA